MTKIINFLNNNAFVTSLFTLLLSFSFTIYIRFLDKKERLKTKEKENVFDKAQFRIAYGYNGTPAFRMIPSNIVSRVDLVYMKYELKKFENQDNYKCIYDKNIKKPENTSSKHFYIENIGKCRVEEIFLTVKDLDSITLVENNKLRTLLKNNTSNVSVQCKSFINPNELVEISVTFLKNLEFNDLGHDLSIYYKDFYGNFYFQNIALDEFTIEYPHRIKSEDFLEFIMKD